MTSSNFRLPALVLSAALLAGALSGCGAGAVPSAAGSSAVTASASSAAASSADGPAAYTDVVPVEEVQIADESVALNGAPALDTALMPVASGVKTQTNGKAQIDYSNTTDGYVMARFTAASSTRIKAQVKGPTTTYTYDLSAGATAWTTFPLSDGNGAYQVTIYENISGTKYASVLSASFTASMADEFAPFLRPNQYVNYENAPNTVAKAAELCAGVTAPLDKVQKIYDFVVKNFTYDKQLAASVQSGYLPVLDTVLAKKTGICFDYAALMAAMLRSEGVPCKLVVGYAGSAYHAWINVWTEESGWIDAVVYFDGKNWQRMDPTFASTGKESAAIMQYIGDGSNYSAKYLY